MITLLQEDCFIVMEGLENVDLVFADPPYNLGVSMGSKKDSIDDYEDFTYRWLDEVVRVLKPGGSGYVAFSQDWLWLLLKYVHEKEEINLRSTIVWHRQTPNYGAKTCLAKMWEPIVHFSKGEQETFNLKDVLVPSRQAGRKVDKWMKKAVGETISAEKNPTDVWEISSAFHSKKEYVGFKGQKPLALLTRIVLLGSNEGDLVFDPFLGSGTTAVACELLNRNFIGCDIDSVQLAEGRLGL